jgi:hypothetical protein
MYTFINAPRGALMRQGSTQKRDRSRKNYKQSMSKIGKTGLLFLVLQLFEPGIVEAPQSIQHVIRRL